jgi:hypothetical protein
MNGFEFSFDEGEINAGLIGLAQREAGVLGDALECLPQDG